MSESKHTQGKWRLRTEHPRASDYVEIIIDTEEREILRACGRDLNIDDFILMVRAPEMYESLKQLIADIDRWEEAVAEIVKRPSDYPWKDLEDARKVIRKAEGRHDH